MGDWVFNKPYKWSHGPLLLITVVFLYNPYKKCKNKKMVAIYPGSCCPPLENAGSFWIDDYFFPTS